MTTYASKATDVNAAFAQTRADQISIAQREASGEGARERNAEREANFSSRVAEGKLRALGGNRFQVTDPGSWDNGEVLVLRREAETGRELILPEHGLAEQPDGTVKVYSSAPMWHGLGTVIPGGISDIDTVLRVAGLDWTVSKRPSFFQARINGRTKIMPHEGQFSLVRDGQEVPVGKCGSSYTVVQNREGFEWLQSLVEDTNVVWESAGQVRDGGRVFISLKLPEHMRIDAAGVNDEIVPFIVAILNHTGMDTNKVMATPWRPICGNTERFATRDAVATWSMWHTSGIKERMKEARKQLGLSHKYYASFVAEETALAQTELEIDGLLKSIEALWPKPDENKAQSLAAGKAMVTRWQQRRDSISDLFTSNAEVLGKTAYAGERAVTQYLDWERAVRVPKSLTEELTRARRIIEGDDNETKTKAHRQLLTLVKAKA